MAAMAATSTKATEPPTLSTTDRFGFFHLPPTTATSTSSYSPSTDPHRSITLPSSLSLSQRKKRLHEDNRRVQKWLHMLENWHTYRTGNRQSKLKSRARKGIPDSLRSPSWLHLSGAKELKRQRPSHYTELQQIETAPWEEQIILDVDRTFPNHVMFQTCGGEGQQQLLRILRAYSLHDEEVGYCQGIGFIAAFLSTYMLEEDVFWMLVALLRGERYNLSGLYRKGMPKALSTMSTMDRMIQKINPRMALHLQSLRIECPLYMTGWLLTLFTSDFPFDYVVRIFDIYICEGMKIVYRIVLALLKEVSSTLLALDFEHTLKSLQRLPIELSNVLTPDELIAKAIAVHITTAEIAAFEEEETSKMQKVQARRDSLRKQRLEKCEK